MRYLLSLVAMLFLLSSPVYAMMTPQEIDEQAAAPHVQAASAPDIPDRPDRPDIPDIPDRELTRIAHLAASAGQRSTLHALSGAYIVMSMFDYVSTTQALNRGAEERNPLLAAMAQHSGTLLLTKAAITASTILMAQRLWKRNRPAAIAVMVGANLATGFIAFHNASLPSATAIGR